jgi:hypothetical protein
MTTAVKASAAANNGLPRPSSMATAVVMPCRDEVWNGIMRSDRFTQPDYAYHRLSIKGREVHKKRHNHKNKPSAEEVFLACMNSFFHSRHKGTNAMRESPQE